MVNGKHLGQNGSKEIAYRAKTIVEQRIIVKQRVISEGFHRLEEVVYCYPLSNSSAVYKKDVQSLGVGGGTPLYGLYSCVWHQRVWFFSILVINRVFSLAGLATLLISRV